MKTKTVSRIVTFRNQAEALRAQYPSGTLRTVVPGGSFRRDIENEIMCWGLETTPPVTITYTDDVFGPDCMDRVDCCISSVLNFGGSINEVPADIRDEVASRVARARKIRAERHSGHSESENSDGTTTVENGTLRVTLPTEEYNRIGRYGVFNDAMRVLGNRSEAEQLANEPIDPTEIMQVAREQLIYEYLSENCRYSLSETMMRMNGGHRMSPGMAEDVSKANAYASGVLAPITHEQLTDWACTYFRQNKCDTPQQERAFTRAVTIKRMELGDGTSAARVLADAAESLEHSRQSELQRRSAIGNTCRNWKIEIIGDMPEQIGLCRYQEAA